MNKKAYVLIVLLAFIGGLIGGMVSVQLFTISPVHAQKESEPAKVIEANEFRVIDKYGNHVASLAAVDSPHDAGMVKKRQTSVLLMNDSIGKSVLTSHELEIIQGETSSSLSYESLNLKQNYKSVLITSSYRGTEGASIRISDDYTIPGRWRTVLGNVELIKEGEGKSIERSAASLVLFDKFGNVFWSTPE